MRRLLQNAALLVIAMTPQANATVTTAVIENADFGVHDRPTVVTTYRLDPANPTALHPDAQAAWIRVSGNPGQNVDISLDNDTCFSKVYNSGHLELTRARYHTTEPSWSTYACDGFSRGTATFDALGAFDLRIGMDIIAQPTVTGGRKRTRPRLWAVYF